MTERGGSRRPIRLRNYDYSQSGLYFVTICVENRSCVLGAVQDGEMRLNEAGKMVSDAWQSMPRFWGADVDTFVVMPNHVHGIVVLGDARVLAGTDAEVVGNRIDGVDRRVESSKGRPRAAAPTDLGQNRGHDMALNRGASPSSGAGSSPTLSTVVGRFKSFTSNRYRKGVRERRWLPVSGTLWQRGFYKHVIRRDDDLDRVREYILNNPMSWHLDKESPEVFL